MQIEKALEAWHQLSDTSESPKLDVELLLCSVLNKPRSYLYTWPDKSITESQQCQFEDLIRRRVDGEPVAYLTGEAGFWTLQLAVSPATLIPRPETELLVELALQKCSTNSARIVDLGTGTGAIALALASEMPEWSVYAVDVIDDAVTLAQRNQKTLALDNVEVMQGSWFEPLQGKFDLIISNPPYIDPSDEHLQQGDVRHEPLSALISGDKGMADIELIAEGARNHLYKGGWLMFEHGYDQGMASAALLRKLGYQQVETVQDFGNRDRVTLGRWE